MKKLRIVVCICFFVLLLIPVFTFNWEENVVSTIDNRALTNNPFGDNYEAASDEVDLTDAIESYVQDRIGLRDKMIYSYTVLHDNLFHEMVHPTYMYGKDGYVFQKVGINQYFGEYHATFAEMVKEIKDYCEARDVPFLFVFEPSKTSLFSEKLVDGIQYDNGWVLQLMETLDEYGVDYVDNTGLLRGKYEEGEMVFNKEYNAGHWNDLGAFYGVNAMLEAMKKEVSGVHINEMDEFTIEERLNTSLPVSEFPIQEYEPFFTNQCTLVDYTQDYDSEVKRDERYSHFEYVVNEERLEEGSPKTLVFQGSYMNEMGYKFLENSLGEYIAVHDYQNVMNFDYYYNIFKPEYVMFEVAEYVFMDEYFLTKSMEDMVLNPPLETFENSELSSKALGDISVDLEEGDRLVTMIAEGLPADTQYAYLVSNGEEFDLKRQEEDGNVWYEATIEKERYQADRYKVIAIDSHNKGVKYE